MPLGFLKGRVPVFQIPKAVRRGWRWGATGAPYRLASWAVTQLTEFSFDVALRQRACVSIFLHVLKTFSFLTKLEI